jgi:hypothetical protein
MVNVQILNESRKHYERFQAYGRHIVLQIRPCPENQNPVTYFRDSLQEILEIIETGVGESDMLVFQIINSTNSVDRPIGLSFRKKDQISVDTITYVFEKVC